MPGAADLWLLMLACGAATYLWRGLGVLLSGRLNPQSALFEWISCVAYALVAGLIARIIVAPSGLLAQTALFDRLLACAVALIAYRLARGNMFVGLVCGVMFFIAAGYVRGAIQ
ncbi:MAG: AzlD domain-containing protein [Burkholderiales bacterium]|nr:AzlD domain-containing protein [Burkholderiales bacterium]